MLVLPTVPRISAPDLMFRLFSFSLVCQRIIRDTRPTFIGPTEQRPKACWTFTRFFARKQSTASRTRFDGKGPTVGSPAIRQKSIAFERRSLLQFRDEQEAVRSRWPHVTSLAERELTQRAPCGRDVTNHPMGESTGGKGRRRKFALRWRQSVRCHGARIPWRRCR